VTDSEWRELLEMVDSVIEVVRLLARGDDPFLDATEDPLGTSSNDYFRFQLDELAESKRGVPIKAAVELRRYDIALFELRSWRDDLKRS
jgi:hypothetical protein